jgi:uncharacterized protein (DUF1800 family)
MMPRILSVLARLLVCAAPCSLPLHAQTNGARLVNLSTRGQVGTGDNILIGGFVIVGASKTVLVRAVGPGMVAYGVSGTLADPLLELVDSKGATIATNDNWSGADLAIMSSVGAFPITSGSKDAVLVATLPPGPYSAKVSGLGGAPTGVVIMEIYDVSGAGQIVNLSNRLQVGTGDNIAIAGFVVASGSGTRKMLIRGIGPTLGHYGVPGTLPDPKLILYDSAAAVVSSAVANGSVSALASATTQAGAFASSADDAATIVTISPGNYTVHLSSNSNASTGVGLIEIYDITDTTGTPVNLASANPRLYYASLRPAVAATSSLASGYATILYDPNTNVATVSVNFANLSSTATSAHLVVGSSASGGNFVFGLPRGQANALTWTFPSIGAYSTADLIAALQSGQLFVDIDSAKFPTGELQGSLILATGSQLFAPPTAPPPLAANALTAPTQTDAARLLLQATFGPTAADITDVTNRGITAWIDTQMTLPATSLQAGIKADLTAFPNPAFAADISFKPRSTIGNLQSAWFKATCTAPDQLRQRVAFALSEIFVVGSMERIDWTPEAKAKYYDLLVNGAFGTYRQLLENITLDPSMGLWLTYYGNPKADPIKGTSPDENYAREVMQLFSIGLVQLQPDGTLLLDAAGQPIPTYDQTTVSETAKVFTGWQGAAFPPDFLDATIFSTSLPGWIADDFVGDDHPNLKPMRSFETFHDKTAKRVVSLQQVPLASATPTPVPASQTAPQDLKILLDTLANHPNAGPFVCRQLIQRLVTSNPSAGYLYRVAQVFANDGNGVRGNLGAVVRAILTDYEARSPDVLPNIGYGKIKEPLIRLTGLFRALNFRAPNGRYLDSYFGETRNGLFQANDPQGLLNNPGTGFGLYQAALYATTVFNFFSPDYSPPGPLAAAGLVAPELQITDTIAVIQTPNLILDFMMRDVSKYQQPPSGPSPFLVPDYTVFLPNAKNPTSLVGQINLLICANQMTPAMSALIVTTLQALPASSTDVERIQTAFQLTVSSPDGAMQK